MGNFYTDVLKNDVRFSSVERCADLEMLEPVTRAVVAAIIADAAAQGLSLMIFETFRSQARQAMLYNNGATKLRRVGVHGFGLACDIVKSIDGEPSWTGDFSFLCHLAHAHGMVSGQDWGHPEIRHSFVDADHVQRISVVDQPKLFSGEWYPDETYSPYISSSQS